MLTMMEPEAQPTATNLADVLTQFGSIAPGRILWVPTPSTATQADLLKCDRHCVELIDATLVEKAVGARASYITNRLIMILGAFIDSHRLGRHFGPDLMVLVHGGQVRLPDFAYYSYTRWGGKTADLPAVMPIAPDLAVEVLSPSNTQAEMERKREEFFASGTAEFWLINPDEQTLTVFTSATASQLFSKDDRLTSSRIFPGFSMPLSKLFAE